MKKLFSFIQNFFKRDYPTQHIKPRIVKPTPKPDYLPPASKLKTKKS